MLPTVAAEAAVVDVKDVTAVTAVMAATWTLKNLPIGI